jgi:hypothetical protein
MWKVQPMVTKILMSDGKVKYESAPTERTYLGNKNKPLTITGRGK